MWQCGPGSAAGVAGGLGRGGHFDVAVIVLQDRQGGPHMGAGVSGHAEGALKLRHFRVLERGEPGVCPAPAHEGDQVEGSAGKVRLQVGQGGLAVGFVKNRRHVDGRRLHGGAADDAVEPAGQALHACHGPSEFVQALRGDGVPVAADKGPEMVRVAVVAEPVLHVPFPEDGADDPVDRRRGPKPCVEGQGPGNQAALHVDREGVFVCGGPKLHGQVVQGLFVCAVDQGH